MTIYTKTGDTGETGLFGGKRVMKNDQRVDAYGTVDELNAFIGWLRDAVPAAHPAHHLLYQVQHRLFGIGAHLAADPAAFPIRADVQSPDLKDLEDAIDGMDAVLPPLKNFILPGGHTTVSMCHICRTICRRAERLVVALHAEGSVDPAVLQYLNRLSDYFFVLARHLGHTLGAPEVVWHPRPVVTP